MTVKNANYEFNVAIESSETAVREALSNIQQVLRLKGLSEGDCGRVEIVFAEAMNNIVEHAYPNERGRVDLLVELSADAVSAVFIDTGCALPDLTLPAGNLPETNVERDSLPEGGFGWFLIRTLTETLEYSRFENKNCLKMRIVRES